MTRRRTWALLAAALALASCGGSGLDRASTEACDTLSAWAASGRPADQRDELVARLGDLLDESHTGVLTDPYRRFRDTVASDELDDAAVAEAGGTFLRACGDRGWEPPEG